YDSHLLMKVVSKFTADKLKCIPENIEKYKAMDIARKIPLTGKHFTEKGYSIEKIELLFRKGVFPYDWTNS
ncbi:7004_t:CDS:2, partial [Racocetra persica]